MIRKIQSCNNLLALVMGASGTGKTTLAAHFTEKPMLWILAEDGVESIKAVPGVEFIDILEPIPETYFADVLKGLDVHAVKDYKTIVLDSITALSDKLFKDALKTNICKRVVMDIGGMVTQVPSRMDYQMAQIRTDLVMDKLMALRRSHNIIVLAHEKVLEVEDPSGIKAVLGVPAVIGQQSARSLAAGFNVVMRLVRINSRMTNEDKRVCRTTGHEVWAAKDRYGLFKDGFDFSVKENYNGCRELWKQWEKIIVVKTILEETLT